MTKILIVALDKSHVILIANDKEFWMKKINKIHFHPLTICICVAVYD